MLSRAHGPPLSSTLELTMKHTTLLSAAALLLAGCASSHNMATDGRNLLGGGYLDSEIANGLYQISVKTNWAPWVNAESAQRAWRGRAEVLCGSDQFRELEIRESSYDELPPMGVMRYIVTTRDGIAVCTRANLSDEQATRLIRGR
jgi:hypothetical protein